MNDEILPNRKWLRHEVPLEVHDRYPVFFITICCQKRGRNTFARPGIWPFLRETVERRNAVGRWNCSLFLAMPDHLHAIVSFADVGQLSRELSEWKRWVARKEGIAWQKGFFDHRLRTSASAEEKREYILQNPVRAGLAASPSDWPYCFDVGSW